jgi:hypothetical protein
VVAASDHEEAKAPVEVTTAEGETGNTEGKEEEEELQSGVALFDFEAQNEGELSFKKGDHVLVLPLALDLQQHGQSPEGNGAGEWRYGYVGDHEGHFPTSYVSISATHTRD